MKTINYFKFYLLLAVMGTFQLSFAQQSLKIDPRNFVMTISGTTNVHDFKSKVTQINGNITFANNQPKTFTLEVPVKSIVSGEKLMDKKTYEAFNESKNPKILFNMTDINSVQTKGDQITANVSGNLTMAGVTKKITLVANGKKVKSGTYEFSGTTQLKFSDFNMKPPTAMLGVMKVGNVITLSYKVEFVGDDVI
ncbi:YceI family protein [uncultured Paludibacter sp.]|uniref:YceI family protein n=1 Tax=uncultured Paludibacter sp. TaxID=497635 RepID=A0A653AHH6_9BACT|nr:YceI family protein [uncultured Paludibacter sp.]